MNLEDLLELMDPCPLCLDISYTDADGVEHLMFDLCEIHRHIEQMAEVCRADADDVSDRAA